MTTVITVDCHFDGFPEIAASYIVTSDNGDIAIIDNNTSKAVPYILKGLEENNLSPDSVKYIIVTHIHLDHSGGTHDLLEKCKNAVVICHPRAERHLIDPTRLVQSSIHVYGKEVFEKRYGAVEPIPKERIYSVQDEEALNFGTDRQLLFLHTRGHAKHHICIFDTLKRHIFSGDSLGMFYPLLQRDESKPYVFPSTTPTDFEPDEALKTIERAKKLNPSRIYVAHYNYTDNIEVFLQKLVKGYERAAELMKFACDSKESKEELLPVLKAKVREDFIKDFEEYGISLEHLPHMDVDTDLNAQGILFSAIRMRG